MVLLTGLLALALASIHLFIGKAVFLHVIPRSHWLSLAGGAATAYVFVYLLPKLADAQGKLQPYLVLSELTDTHVYFMALLGLMAFYGLNRVIEISNSREREGKDDTDQASHPVFWLHVGSFTLYNILIGYLLLNLDDPGYAPLLVYFVAMAFHTVTTDFMLLEEHRHAYQRHGRWLLAAAVLIGWGLGAHTGVDERLLAVLLAVLAGSIVLNVLREELPEARESRFWPFFLGAIGYGVPVMLL